MPEQCGLPFAGTMTAYTVHVDQAMQAIRRLLVQVTGSAIVAERWGEVLVPEGLDGF